jgi:hypothetical protein
MVTGAIVQHDNLRPVLAKIAEAHHKTVYMNGLTDGYCHECGWAFPCPTYRWATEHHDPSESWDLQPDEDEEDEE